MTMVDSKDRLVDGEEGKSVSDNERLISAVRCGFNELIKKQEEQTTRINRAIEALKPPRSTDTKTAFWESYMKLADEHDKEFQKKYSNDLDTSLIFAGLFSAVSSAFIIQLQPELGLDPPPIIIVAQSFLYISLFTTLFAALLAVLGKQWITYYEAAGSRGSIEERGLERQRKFDGLRQWKFDVVLQSFPLLLQLAVFLFSAALSIYLWTVHHTIAIIAIALTSSAFTAYILLLASAIVSADSPFRTPLASLLVWSTQLAFRNKLARFFSQDLWPVISFLLSSLKKKLARFFSQRLWRAISSPKVLPYSASDVSKKLGSQFADLYPAHLFVPLSAEIPAVLWVLETSTDHRMIEVAANMAVRLQWPLGPDLSPPMARLYETFQSCFEMHPNGSDRNVRPGMIHRAITCGRAYCSLRVVGHTSDWTFRDMKILPSQEHQPEDPQFRQLLDVLAIGARRPTPLVGPWDDSFAVEWALHTTRRPRYFRPFELESQLNDFLDRFPVEKLSSLNHSGFTNYICLINFILSHEEVRVGSQRDKSSLRLNLLANLFELLRTATISSDLTARIIYTVQSLDKLAGRIYIREEGPSALRLFVSVIEFCSTFAGTDGWLDVTVSAAKLARVEGQENWRNFQGVWHRNRCFQNVNPRNMDCMYMAIDHVRQSWEQARSDAEDPATWDTNTAEAVDGLLQILASSTAVLNKPSSGVFDVVLKALSDARTCSPAAVVLYQCRHWLLDLDVQKMVLESGVWPYIASFAKRHPALFAFRYIEMASTLVRAPEWRPCLYAELAAWIAAFTYTAHDAQTVQQFNLVTSKVWVPDWTGSGHNFADTGEQCWALIVSALCNVWQAFDFTQPLALGAAVRLAQPTVAWSFLKLFYIAPRSPGKMVGDYVRLAVGIRIGFCAQLAKSLVRAVANARDALADPTQDAMNKEELEWFTQLLEALAQKLETTVNDIDASGVVQLGGSTRAYKNTRELREIFEAEIKAVGKSLQVDFDTL
ncbi:hypothetical protein MSAN_01053400 [Mycena sanguinolenta]|uniref:DUF6535 domain-containing protein n=1 Tax=Mycena sanguinolenta TaxID=230812 RepID=A0A8H6YTB7_9AGAR|nr:hypothetical protein MSAN_01053400 [Mycena sanguinolenta]